MTIDCRTCGTTNRQGASFCLGCGGRLEPPPASASVASPTDPDEATAAARCAHCGAENRIGNNFCRACGSPVVVDTAATAVMPTTPPPASAAPAAPGPPLHTAPAERRSRTPIIVAVSVVISLLFAGAALALFITTGGDDQSLSSEDRDDSAAVDETPTSAAPTSTEPEASTAPTTVSAQVTPTTTVPPTTTLPPTTTAVETTLPEIFPGDLGLPQPMTRPPCDDTYIAVLASALDPATNAAVVSDVLARFPGSSYLKTRETCPSLRPDVDGAEIYVVYYGPYLTTQEACAARLNGPSDAYVRTLSLTAPDTHRINC